MALPPLPPSGETLKIATDGGVTYYKMTYELPGGGNLDFNAWRIGTDEESDFRATLNGEEQDVTSDSGGYSEKTEPDNSIDLPEGDNEITFEWSSDTDPGENDLGGIEIFEFAMADNIIGKTDAAIYAIDDDGTLQRLDAAGDIQWSVASDSYNNDGLAVDSGGNAYTGGGKLVKIDADGNVVWENDFTGAIDSAVTDSSGNIYIGGSTSGVGAWVKKASQATGVFEWTCLMTDMGTGRTPTPYCLAIDGSGNVYAGRYDTYAAKVDSSGSIVWEKNLFTGTVNGAAIDSNGSIFMGDDDQVLKKLDSDGTVVASIDLGTYGVSYGIYDIAIDANDNIYAVAYAEIYVIQNDFSVVASFFSDADLLDVHSVTVNSNGYLYIGDINNLFKVDSDGNKVWQTSIGNAERPWVRNTTAQVVSSGITPPTIQFSGASLTVDGTKIQIIRAPISGIDFIGVTPSDIQGSKRIIPHNPKTIEFSTAGTSSWVITP